MTDSHSQLGEILESLDFRITNCNQSIIRIKHLKYPRKMKKRLKQSLSREIIELCVLKQSLLMNYL